LVNIPHANRTFVSLQLRQGAAEEYLSALQRDQFSLASAVLEATSISPTDTALLFELDRLLTELLSDHPISLLILTSPSSNALVDMVDLIHRRERALYRASLMREEFLP